VYMKSVVYTYFLLRYTFYSYDANE